MKKKQTLLYEIWGYHVGNYEDYCLTGSDAM
jgi:hypothetical protein